MASTDDRFTTLNVAAPMTPLTPTGLAQADDRITEQNRDFWNFHVTQIRSAIETGEADLKRAHAQRAAWSAHCDRLEAQMEALKVSLQALSRADQRPEPDPAWA